MADDSEEKPSATYDIASATASIFDTLNNLRRWRAEQLAEVRKKQHLEGEKLLQPPRESQQHLEGEKLLQLPRESQKQPGQLKENGIRRQNSDLEDKPKETVPEISDTSSISVPNDLDSYDTLQESSITAHLQRCLNDSTQSNISVSGNKVQHVVEKAPVFSELRNPQFSEKNLNEKDNRMIKTDDDKMKTKRPFLKKGSGLRRFMPKSNNNAHINNCKDSSIVNKYPVKKAQLPQKTLKLKPALRETVAPSEQVRHIRFDIADSDDEENINAGTNNKLFLASNRNATGNNIYEDNRTGHSIPTACTTTPIPTVCTTIPENNELDTSNFGNESVNLSKESKELEEFEMLENCAQNSSFNSESSVVQRVIHGGSTKPSCASENNSRTLPQNIISMKEVHAKPLENLVHSEKSSLNKCNEEVRVRKQFVEEVIADINPRIQSLQKEISYDKKQTLDDDDINDRCSTPMNLEGKNLISESDSNIGSSVFEVSPEVQANRFMDDDNEADNLSDFTCDSCKKCCNLQDAVHICNDEEEVAYNYFNEAGEFGSGLNKESKVHSKLLQLHHEIQTYQQLNAKLSADWKERKDVLRKLTKERDDFHKYKEMELQKLEAHIQEERRQIKRQKETFNRLQKLSKDNPTKKERDELSALRLEIEKLNEELKRQKIKYNSDSRRWKTCLDNAEREKDSFKLENIRLEEQCQDLLTTLKIRMKKNIKSFDDDCTNIHKNENEKNVEKKDAESQTEEKELDFDVFQDSNQSTPKLADERNSKSKTHLILDSESGKNNIDINDKDTDIHAKDPSKNNNFIPKQNVFINRLDTNGKVTTENVASTCNLSVITVSGESDFREIDNGNWIERIYASGEKEVFYKSGTRKVISADGKIRKFFFYNGDHKEVFSDGKEIYTYLNGIIETLFPDGMKITEFPNGQIQRRYPSGQKEVIYPDGTVQKFLNDGSEEIHTADGNIVTICTDGTKIIKFANGQKEIRTSSYKKREFPDGSVKIIYDSGKQETRYSSGRIKIKNEEGKIVFDTKYLNSSKG